MKFYVYHFNAHGLRIAEERFNTIEDARTQAVAWAWLLDSDESIKIVEQEGED